MTRAAIGVKIKSKRKALGITQAALAGEVGVSASYLNLIENGKRSVGGGLLIRIARALDTNLEALDDAEERMLLASLQEIAADGAVQDAHPDRNELSEFVGRHPSWARALVQLHRAYSERDRTAGALAERLSQDPVLQEGVHRMISHVSAIRSVSEILEDVEDLTPDQLGRFHRMIGQESARLADVSQALSAFFKSSEDHRVALTPDEEVDAFIAAARNHFPAMEDAAAALLAEAQIAPETFDARIAAWLEWRCGLRVELSDPTPAEALSFRRGARVDEAAGRLELIAVAPQPRRRFELARLAIQRAFGPEIEALVAADPRLRSEAGRRRAAGALASYAAAAALMPYDAFIEQAERLGYDLEALATRFSVSVEQAAHRAATLRRPGSEGVPFGFMRVDPSGFVTKRLALPGLPLPRIGGACPLWAIYRAFQTPGRVIAQPVAFPSGDRFLFIARTQEKTVGANRGARHLVSIQLACDAIHADRVVYGREAGAHAFGRGEFGAPALAPEPVGATCRLCAREGCPARQEEIVAIR